METIKKLSRYFLPFISFPTSLHEKKQIHVLETSNTLLDVVFLIGVFQE